MCRNIKTLYNFDPPATEEEIRDAALQFVRKVSGFHKPSEVNNRVFEQAVNNITHDAQMLLETLTTNASVRNRREFADRARARGAKRFGKHV